MINTVKEQSNRTEIHNAVGATSSSYLSKALVGHEFFMMFLLAKPIKIWMCIMSIMMSLSAYSQTSTDNTIYPICIDGKYGFINTSGQVVVNPKFDWADTLSEGLAAVKMGEKWGYVDEKGVFVIKPQFDYANSFVEGMASVLIIDEISRQKQWTFIDNAGKMISSPKFDDAGIFSEGLAVVIDDGDYCYIDKNAKTVYITGANIAYDFSEGLACIRKRYDRMNYRCGFMNKNGKTVVRPLYLDAYDFQMGWPE